MKLNQGLMTRKAENYWGQRKSSLEMKGKRGSVFVFESTSVLGISPAIIIISALHYFFYPYGLFCLLHGASSSKIHKVIFIKFKKSIECRCTGVFFLSSSLENSNINTKIPTFGDLLFFITRYLQHCYK